MKVPEELQFMVNARLPQKTTDARLDGKRVIITGATSGVGYVAAKRFAAGGADIVMVVRNPEKAAKVRDELVQTYGVRVDVVLADFSKLPEVRTAAAEVLDRFPQDRHPDQQRRRPSDKADLHGRGFRDGLLCQPPRFVPVHPPAAGTGHRERTGPHHPGQFRRPPLWDGASGRPELGTSPLHRPQILRRSPDGPAPDGVRSWRNAWQAPGLPLMPCTRGRSVPIWAWTGKTICFYRVYKRYFLSLFLKPPEISGDALYYLGAAPEMAGVTGKFFNLTIEEKPAAHALDRELGKRVWTESETLTGLS